MVHLLIYLSRLGDGVGDGGADQFAVSLPQAVDGCGDGPWSDFHFSGNAVIIAVGGFVGKKAF